ncbi:MAG: glycine--tRNA ligase subunit beta [Bryobacteraceae bacterium]
MADFLLETGVEEIPDWMIEPALADLHARFQKLLDEAKLAGSVSWTDATPRRLVLKAAGLVERQADSEELVSGPPKSAGAGAAQGFAKKNGTTVDKLETVTTDKGEYFSFRKQVKGRPTGEILGEALPGIITGLYFPKTMYWTGKGGARFIRPIRWIVALLGADVVPFDVAGVRSSDTTYGHRILGAKGPIPVTIENYEEQLRKNFVIVKAAERQQRIEAALGSDVEPDAALLKTLVYLTEWPTPIRGSFDPAYLELPKEILSTVMRHHQRYFSVLKTDGSLAPEFVAITNTDGDPDRLIRQGNERVLRARFNDARFFWKVDQQKKLADRVDDLKKVTFQAKLEKPTYWDKTERMVDLARQLAAALGIEPKQEAIARAAYLAKADLTTDMVKEFTELQGVVGGLYAKVQGESEAVATAIYDHYKPVSMEDSIPRTVEGQVVAVADKLDTLRACFGVGLIPSGSKDPFALRRAAQGLVKILFEGELPLHLPSVVGDNPELQSFLDDRIGNYLREIRHYAYDEVSAAMSVSTPHLADLERRIAALQKVRATPDFEPLAASFKRIKNILKQAQVTSTAPPDETLLAPGPEGALYVAFTRVREQLKTHPTYEAKLEAIASLRPEVDLFFDKILVNDPDEKVRRNRLALLNSLLTEFSNIADFSEIVPKAAQ